jgi:tungstate transport system substrate-binding protein
MTRRVGIVLAGLAVLGLLGWGGFYVHSRWDDARTLILATTTSTYDSGLLDVLLPPFEAANKGQVDVVAVGSGQALELGRNGDADVLLVHSPAAEQTFMAEGHGLSRTPLMYNDFIIIGPPNDPLALRGKPDVQSVFVALAAAGAEGKAVFLSRGDDSGTDKKEKGLWAKFSLATEGAWYQEVGAGMGDTLRMTAEQGGYTLTDRATYLARYGQGSEGQGSEGQRSGEGQLAVVFEGGQDLYNPYAVIIVDPVSHPNVNLKLAEAFTAYLASEEARQIISTFGADKYGQPLFWLLP